MRRVWLALLCASLLFASARAQTNQSNAAGNACLDETATLSSVAVNASTTSAVQLIALSSGKKIFVCSLTIIGGGTSPTFSLVYGTGTNCGTGQATLSTAIPLSTTATFTFSNPVGVTPASQALCTLLAGTSPTAKGILSYVQQ